MFWSTFYVLVCILSTFCSTFYVLVYLQDYALVYNLIYVLLYILSTFCPTFYGLVFVLVHILCSGLHSMLWSNSPSMSISDRTTLTPGKNHSSMQTAFSVWLLLLLFFFYSRKHRHAALAIWLSAVCYWCVPEHLQSTDRASVPDQLLWTQPGFVSYTGTAESNAICAYTNLTALPPKNTEADAPKAFTDVCTFLAVHSSPSPQAVHPRSLCHTPEFQSQTTRPYKQISQSGSRIHSLFLFTQYGIFCQYEALIYG